MESYGKLNVLVEIVYPVVVLVSNKVVWFSIIAAFVTNVFRKDPWILNHPFQKLPII